MAAPMGLAGPRLAAGEAIATSAVVLQAEATAMSAVAGLEAATATDVVADLEAVTALNAVVALEVEIVLKVAADLVAVTVSSAMGLRGIAATGLIPRGDPVAGLTALGVTIALIVVLVRIARTAVVVQLPVMAALQATPIVNRKLKA